MGKNGILLHVWGEYACFTRLEMKVERVSYDIITPSAARGILEAIYWKPAFRWIVDRICVLNPIKFETIRRNELGGKISLKKINHSIKVNNTDSLNYFIEEDRQQRASTILRDVSYLIQAHLESTGKIKEINCEHKHSEIFKRRARKGQCFHYPYFGNREFPVNFTLLENVSKPQISKEIFSKKLDLGWMLNDIDFSEPITPKFFRAIMQNGWIDIPLL